MPRKIDPTLRKFQSDIHAEEDRSELHPWRLGRYVVQYVPSQDIHLIRRDTYSASRRAVMSSYLCEDGRWRAMENCQF